jgi:predicted N-acetyltransferase YhbS
MISIRKERPPDVAARETLLDEAFGDLRWRKSSQRLRDGRRPTEGLAFVAVDGQRVVGTARLWTIVCGTGLSALLLGPVAVAADCRNRGIGGALIDHALNTARRRGYRAVVLIGDAAYYGRFGFSAEKTGALRMPGPFERDRLLALELVPGALKGARGLLRAPSQPASQPNLASASAA